MGKSKYPEKYDTSVEIPQIRGNINEISVDLLSSIRSAIFQIEHTLGINPQGSSSNTVSERLTRSLDNNGNIKKEALDKAGVIYGPITNENIANLAGIDESKLKLDYPTKLLQTELSLSISKINEILTIIEDVSSKISSHIYKDTPNRHTSRSILVEGISASPSVNALSTIEDDSLYNVVGKILNNHILFDGTAISSDNSSHQSDQIYFNNIEVSDLITSGNVQDAIEEIAILASGQEKSHQNNFHGNGYLNYSNLSAMNQTGLLAEDLPVTFTSPSSTDSTRKTRIYITTPIEIFGLEVGDIAIVNFEDESIEYYISDIYYSSNNIASINVFGSIQRSSTVNTTISFKNKIKRLTPEWGWSPTVLEYPDLLSAGIVQFANQNSPGIISEGFTPNSISSSFQFEIEIDGKSYFIETYKAGVPYQTIEATISAINESLLEQGAGALAYKVFSKKTGQNEISIVSNFYGTDKYIKVTASGNQLDLLKLNKFKDKIIYGNSGSSLVINGSLYSSPNIILSLSGLTLDVGLSSISGIDFSQYQLKVGDIINISGSNLDDGSYIIETINEDTIFVNASQLPGGTWASTSSETTKFEVFRNTISLDSYNFLETGGSPQGTLLELAIDSDKNPIYRTKLEYKMTFYSGQSLYSIVNCSQVIENVSEILNFEIINSELYCYFNSEDKIKITGYKNTYLDLYSKNNNLFITLIIYSSDDIISYMSSLSISSLSRELYFYQKPDYENIVLIGNISFSSANGRVEGGYFRLPYVYNKKDTGSLKYKDLSRDAVYNTQELPVKETRSSGVVSGLELLSASIGPNSTYLVTISPGIAYISGKRFEFSKFDSIDTGIDATIYDKIVLFINSDGNIFADSADPSNCNFYINLNNNISLGTIEYNNIDLQIIDQRLIISNIDLKILNSVTVSPVAGMGHFTSINKAIKYAKRFSQIYPDAGIPEIILKAGTHRVEVVVNSTFAGSTTEDLIRAYDSSGIMIDFPVKITGEGDSTVLDIITGWDDYPISSDDRNSSAKNRGYILINGSASSDYPAFSNDNFSNGSILLKDFKLKNSTIMAIEPLLLSSSTEKYLTSVDINGIYFDWSNLIFPNSLGPISSTNYFNNGYAFKVLATVGLIPFFGGFTISNCLFDTCFIDLSNNISFSNLFITNNKFFSQDEKEKPLAQSFLVKVSSVSTSSVLRNNNIFIGNNPVFNGNNTRGYLFYDSTGTSGILAKDSGIFVSKSMIGNDSASFVDDSLLVDSTGIEVNGNAIVNNDLNVVGNINVSSDLYVVGESTFESNLLPENNSVDIGTSSDAFRAGYFTTIRSAISNVSTLARLGSAAIVLENTSDTSVPSSKLHIRQNTLINSATTGAGLRIQGTSDYTWDIYYGVPGRLYFSFSDLSASTSTDYAYIQPSGPLTVLNFTGQHKCCVSDGENISKYKELAGLIVVSYGKYKNIESKDSLPTINESLPMISISTKRNQKNVFGVISDAEDLDDTERKYQLGSFVTVTQKSPTLDDTRVVVNSVGEGAIWVIDQGGSLENGDYITTSDVPGYGMKQSDDILRNYTVAKITEDCNFENIIMEKRIKLINYNGIQYKAVLVGCTYHCG